MVRLVLFVAMLCSGFTASAQQGARAHELNILNCGRITQGNAEYLQCMENRGPDAHPSLEVRKERLERARALDQKARDSCANKARTSVEPALREACKASGKLK